MEAHVKGGLLDKILKTPVGADLIITRQEADILIASGAVVFQGAKQDFLSSGECVILGRTLKVERL